jgi:hypothetical protein
MILTRVKTMLTTLEKGEADATKVVRMYPNNQLKAQVRDLKDTLSAFSVIAAAVSR